MSGLDVRYNRLPTQKILVETSVGDPEILSAEVRTWKGKAWHSMPKRLTPQAAVVDEVIGAGRSWQTIVSFQGGARREEGRQQEVCLLGIGECFGFRGPVGKIPYSVA
jgi:hypothetical protein